MQYASVCLQVHLFTLNYKNLSLTFEWKLKTRYLLSLCHKCRENRHFQREVLVTSHGYLHAKACRESRWPKKLDVELADGLNKVRWVISQDSESIYSSYPLPHSQTVQIIGPVRSNSRNYLYLHASRIFLQLWTDGNKTICEIFPRAFTCFCSDDNSKSMKSRAPQRPEGFWFHWLIHG